jgi:fucose permease
MPLINYNFPLVLVMFALLGIGNTILQVSLNPMVTNVISQDKIASSLTLGQFIKAISSFLGPICAAFAASRLGNWKLIFPVYGVVSLLSALWLMSVKIERETILSNNNSFKESFRLLKNTRILLLFLGILMIVGVDVGLNTTIPKLLMVRCNLPLDKAGLGTSLYFAARTIGAFFGALILVKNPVQKVFPISMVLAILAYIVLISSSGLTVILVAIFLVGIACANVFSMIFSLAIQNMPERTNEVSGLMITGVAGGALVLPVMGMLSDKYGIIGGMFSLLFCLLYVLVASLVTQKKYSSV